MGNPAHSEKENKMKILCNVSLMLVGKKSAKCVKLASVDVTERVSGISNRLHDLDQSCTEVCGQMVEEFAEEHNLDQTMLCTSITVRVWG